MNKLITFIFGLFLFLSISTSVQGANHYIRSGATGSANGSSWANAWTDLPATFVRGDTYYVAAGTYGSHIFNQGTSGTTYIKIQRATAAVNSGDAGWNAAYDGQAVFSAPLFFGTGYWIFDGMKWNGFKLLCNDYYSYSGAGGSVNIAGDYVELRSVHMYGTYTFRGGGQHSYECFGNNCTVYNCYFQGSVNEDHMDLRGTHGTYLIEHCAFTHLGKPTDDSTHRDLMNPESPAGNGGWGLTFRNNLVGTYRPGNDGSDMFDCLLMQEPVQLGDILIEGNVFCCGHNAFRYGSGSGGGSSMTIRNNVFWYMTEQPYTVATFQNNVYGGVAYFVPGQDIDWDFIHSGDFAASYCAWVGSAKDVVSGTGNISGIDAKFIDPTSVFGADGIPFTADDGFNVQAGSPLIGAGVATTKTTDILGNTLPAHPTIGAYEYAPSAPSTNPPVITVQPKGVTNSTTGGFLLSVTATGSSLTYQWRTNGVAISGASSFTYSQVPATTNQSGSYDVIITNLYGAVTSSPAVSVLITNVPPTAPSITAQPQSQSVAIGATATFSVTASGTAPLSYQWRANGVNISGATSSSYSLANCQLSNSGTNFSVVVTNSAGSVTSSSALLTVSSQTTANITFVQPTGQDSGVAGYTTLTMPFSSTNTAGNFIIAGVLTPTASTTTISDTKGNTYTLATSSTISWASYTLRIYYATNIAGGANSVIVGVNPAGSYEQIAIGEYKNVATFAPLDVSAIASGTGGTAPATLSVGPMTTTTAGDLIVIFAQDQSGVLTAGTGFTNRADYGTVLSDRTQTTPGSITGTVLDSAGSDPFLLIMAAFKPAQVPSAGTAPTITSQPVGYTNYVGSSFTLSLIASGTAPISYQWFRGNLVNWTNITGATNTTYSVPTATTNSSGWYSCFVSNSLGSVYANTNYVSINEPISVNISKTTGLRTSKLIY